MQWTLCLIALAAVFSLGSAQCLPDGDRVDCYPEPGSTEQGCIARECSWCPSSGGPDIPWCFYPDGNPGGSTLEPPNCLPDDQRQDCYPDAGANEPGCIARNCTWCPSTGDNVPWCYTQRSVSYGYKVVGEPVDTPSGFKLTLARIEGETKHSKAVDTLEFEVYNQADYRLRITIKDPTSQRFEVPIQIDPPAGGNANPLYEVEYTADPFSWKVVRKSSGTVLFDSSMGLFTYEDQYIEFSSFLPNKNLYGIGENEQPSFRHNFDSSSRSTTWPLYARDQPPNYDANMYGVHPHYTVLEDDGNTHAVAIVNSNAQQFKIEDAPGYNYRTIGGILDFYFFLGPTPENAVQQYTEAVGRSPLPSYWSLGFQICKYGYNDLETMKGVVDRTLAANIPQDVQYGDIDIMDRQLDFTVSEDRFGGLPEYVKELKAKGVKFVTILDPCISTGEPSGSYRAFDLGEEMDVWTKRSDGVSNVIGKVWPNDPVYFPDYSKNSTRDYWITLIKEFHDLLQFDGLWIDMNEPANFGAGDTTEGCVYNNWNNPPYLPNIRGGSLSSSTLCPDHVAQAGRHYDTHSLFGWFQSEPTRAGALAARPGKRATVLSRSTFLGSGRWVAHWLGDNFSQWSNLHFSIIGMLSFNLFGIPFVGSDICGFIGDSTPEMCQRWQELGAFYPFSRNHNGIGYKPQDPAAWGPEVAESSRKALEIRYTLLPTLYTLFYDHLTQGNTVARALWHEFPVDTATHGLDTQFLWGQSFMIAPVLDQDATSRDIYFPDARWFSYYDGVEVSRRASSVNVDVPMDFVPLYVRGGFVLPTQEPALNTELSRLNPFGAIVALGDDDTAYGHVYYDDGDQVDSLESGQYYLAHYIYENGELETIIDNDGWSPMSQLRLNTIRLLGSKNVSRARLNGREIPLTKSASGEITLTNLNLDPTVGFKIKFD